MFLGRDDFVWWMGVVEDNYDPYLLGRVQVRIFGYHPPKHTGEIPTKDLPWAVCIHSPNVMGAYGRPEIGDWVVGFFLDGRDSQEPLVFGVLPGNTLSNLGEPGFEWSAPSDVSYPAIYYNENIRSDTNRNSYTQNIKDLVRFVLDPEGGITQQPRVELSIPNKYIRLDMYSDSVYPEVPEVISDYLILENGIKTVFAKSDVNDGSMTMNIPGNGQINFVAQGKVNADNTTEGGHITLTSKFGNIITTTDKGSIQLINTSGNLALVGGKETSKITITNDKGSISIANNEGPIGIKTTGGGNILLSTLYNNSSTNENAGDYLVDTRNYYGTITQNLVFTSGGTSTFTSKGSVVVSSLENNTTIASPDGSSSITSSGNTSVIGNTAVLISSGSDIAVTGTVDSESINYPLLETLRDILASLEDLNDRVTAIENELAP